MHPSAQLLDSGNSTASKRRLQRDKILEQFIACSLCVLPFTHRNIRHSNKAHLAAGGGQAFHVFSVANANVASTLGPTCIAIGQHKHHIAITNSL
ncbi:hypothetical protein D3C81_1916480 [compost metagenome]